MVWCELFTALSLMLSEQSSQILINYWFSFIFHERKHGKCQRFLKYKHAVKVFSLPQSPIPAPGCSIYIRQRLSSFSIKHGPINISQFKNSVFPTVSQGSVLVYLILVPCFYELENVFLNQKTEKSTQRWRKLLATFFPVAQTFLCEIFSFLLNRLLKNKTVK